MITIKMRNVALSVGILLLLALPGFLLFSQLFTDNPTEKKVLQAANLQTVILYPEADAYVDSDDPDSNYGSSTLLKIRDGNPDNNSDVKSYSFIRFDDSPYWNYHIESANLRLSVHDHGGYKGKVKIMDVVDIDSIWQESTINYNNKPDFVQTLATVQVTRDNENDENDGAAWNDNPVTDLTTALLKNQGKKFSIQIASDYLTRRRTQDNDGDGITEIDYNGSLGYYSREKGYNSNENHGPELEIIYDPTRPRVIPTPAPTEPPFVPGQCTYEASEIIIALDTSASMYGGSDIIPAKNAAKFLIDQLSANVHNRIGLVTFNSEANTTLHKLGLGNSHIQNLKSKVDQSVKGLGTCIQCAAHLADEELHDRSRPNTKKFVILITDGKANQIEGDLAKPKFKTGNNYNYAMQATYEEIVAAHERDNTIYMNVGYGTGGNGNFPNGAPDAFLQAIADATDGKYFKSPNIASLPDIYGEIRDAIGIGVGVISGLFFEDMDRNGIKATNEAKLSGWDAQLSGNGLINPLIEKTQNNGVYTFTGLCDGTYQLDAVMQLYWLLTSPINPSYYNVTLKDGKAVNSKNFGVVKGFRAAGSIINDINKNSKLDPGETTYKGPIAITSNSGSVNINSLNGTYEIIGLTPGTYTVSFGNLPKGYILIHPKNGPPPTYKFTVGPGCVTDFTTGASCDAIGNIINLNLAITDAIPWIQTQGMNMRIDKGFTNFVPSSPSCSGAFTSIPNASSSAGIIYTGDEKAEFGKGKSSESGWLVGGESFPQVFRTVRERLTTSYLSILGNIDKSGVELKNLVCNLNSCDLTADLPSGAYLVSENLNLNAYSFPASRNYIFLVNGDLTVSGNITIPKSSTAIFTASGNITIDSSVGSIPSCTASSNLQGIYSADKNFIIDGIDNCTVSNDKMLTVEGSIFVNAEIDNGIFINKRDLCNNNYNFPSIRLIERLDFIINSPNIIKRKGLIYSEEAP